MSMFKRSVPAFLCLLLLAPLPSQAQIAEILNALGLGTGASSAADGDLSCAVRGADGDVACGGIGLEELLELCPELEGPDGTVLGADCEFLEMGDFEMEGVGLVEGKPMVLRGVNFEFDSAKLTPESRIILDQAVEVLEARPSLLVSVDGHTDSKGHPDYNKRLSNDRARSVQKYFINAGINEDRVVYRGFGQESPIADNTHEDGSDNPVGRAENRRVELTVIDEDTFAEVKQANIEAEKRRAAAPRPAPKPAPTEKPEEEKPADEERPVEREREVPAFDESDYLEFLQATEAEPETETAPPEPARVEPDEAEEEFLDFLGDEDIEVSDEGAETEAETEAEDDADEDAEQSEADSDFDESEYLEFLRSLDEE